MKFGAVALAQAEGSVLAHSVVVGGQRLRKAHVLTAGDIALFAADGIAEVIVATLEPGDVGENEAAAHIAQALGFDGAVAKPAATGRVNIFACHDGLFTVDKALIDAINAVDADATIATLAPHVPVGSGQMVATIKIIPFAIHSGALDAIAQLAASRAAFAVHPFRACRAGLIQTVLPGVKNSVLDKTARVTEDRLSRSGSIVSREVRIPHDAGAVASAIAAMARDNDMVLVFGASAMSDPDEDVIPAAIRASGGVVLRSGMPVDPGNLFVLGERAGKPVLGAPGCARSPRLNGFDWILDRICAGLAVTSQDIAAMGVGGLLMEIPSRPQPREPMAPQRQLQVQAVVLAAGRSSRMHGSNKLLALLGGERLIRRTVSRALASRVSGVIVVSGHQGELVEEALQGLDLEHVRNHDFAGGLSTSLRAGIAAVSATADGAIVILGDMPGIAGTDIDRLVEVFRTSGGGSVVRAVYKGRRGNPVILPRALFDAVAGLEGDTGARHLIETADIGVIDVDIGPGATLDIDTPEALENVRGLPGM